MGAIETAHIWQVNMTCEIVGYLWELTSLSVSPRHLSKNKPHKLIVATEAKQQCEQVMHHPSLALEKKSYF